MSAPLVVIFHQSPRGGDPPLTRVLGDAREALLRHHRRLFEGGGGRVTVLPGRDASAREDGSFGERLAGLIADEPAARDGLVVLGSGAVPLLRATDALRLVAVAAGPPGQALTNNRYSSDVCAIAGTTVLQGLPALPSDNALPRWLEEHAGFLVLELGDRDRLALDLDTPADLALLRLAPGTPAPLLELAAEAGLAVPCLAELRALAADPLGELLVAGRSGSRTLRWLERHVRCRVRFLAEERGLRASSPLAVGRTVTGRRARPRPPRSTLGRLLELRGPEAFGAIVAELADGAVIDTRVLLADHLGPSEEAWPSPEDRYASDLLAAEVIADPWLRALTRSAATAPVPILPGGHTLVGPGVPLLLGPDAPPERQRAGGAASTRKAPRAALE